jgi:hypothetical protein
VGKDLIDVDPLVLEHHADDQAVLVASDVENRQIAHHVRGRKRFANVFGASPFRNNGRVEPDLQRGFDIREFRRSLEEPALADNVQNYIPADC